MTPAKGQPSPRKGQRYPPETYTPAEVDKLLAQCSRRAPTGVRNRALIALLYRSGLRISEVLALRPADVDLHAHSLRLLKTKSGEAQTRGFHPSADDALMRWIDTRSALGFNGGRKLFCTLEGGPLNDRYVRAMLHRIAGKAGIDKRVTPHGFRHSFAGDLEAHGTPVTTVSQLLGHGGVATTEKYLRALTNHQAVAALGEVDLPALMERKTPPAGEEEAATAAANPDLEAIREILANPEAVAALAEIARTAAGRKRRKPQ
jgi:integrase/recombinase XerD